MAGIPKTGHRQRLEPLNSGLGGIKNTLEYMRGFVNTYKTDPLIFRVSRELVRHLPQKDFKGEIDTLRAFVQNSIRYTRDINGVETVQTPVKTLEYGVGDCDDKSALLAALLESIGFKTRFHAMGFSKNNVSHVLLEVLLGGDWIPLETTEPVAMGWIPPNIQTSLYG